MPSFSALFDRALVLAALVHEGVPRKGTVIPYIIHPVHVATLLIRHGYDEPLVIAGLLHDVLEDIDYDDGVLQQAIRTTFPRAALPGAIVDADTFRAAFVAFFRQEFSDEVFDLVRQVTESKNDGGEVHGWTERKRLTLDHLRHAEPRVVALKAADALHNVRSILEDISHHGATVLGRFKASPRETAWYYASVSRIVGERLEGAPIADELGQAAAELQQVVDAGPSAGS